MELDPQMACTGAALDSGSVEAVDIELVPHFFKKAEFGFFQRAIGCGHIAGKGVGRFRQTVGQGFADKTKERIEPIFLFEKVEDGLRDRG